MAGERGTGRANPLPRQWPMAALFAILVVALWLRLRGLAFGLPALLDPDEPIFVLIGLKLLKEGTLNPGWFGHPGTTTIYTMALVEAGVFLSGQWSGRFPDVHSFTTALFHDPGFIFLPGRVVMVIFGLSTILLTYRLARDLFGVPTALLTAALLAIDPLHIRYSQIIRTDMQATVFVLLTLLAAVRVVRTGRLRDYVLAGIWLGIACATKWPSAMAAAGVFCAAALQSRRDRGAAIRGAAVFGLVTVASCIAVSPYLVLDFPTLVSNLHGEARPIHLGGTGHGFLGNIWWYLSTPLATALGGAGLALALAGFVLGTRARPVFGIVVGSTAAALLCSISVQHLIWERWVVPSLPLLTIAAAYATWWLIGWVRAWRPALATPAALSLFAAVGLPPLLTANAQAAERATDTRRLATAWARAHIPAGSVVGIEYLAFDVLSAPWRFIYPAGDRGCIDVRANLTGQVTVAKVGQWRRSRPIVDFGGVEAAAAATCRADYLILSNYDRYLAEATRFPDAIANYRRIVAGGRQVAHFEPRSGTVGGPSVRIIRLPRSPAVPVEDTARRAVAVQRAD